MNIKTLPRSTVSLTCLLLDSNISWAVRGPLISRGMYACPAPGRRTDKLQSSRVNRRGVLLFFFVLIFFFQKHHTLPSAARQNFKREARQGLPGQQKGRPPSKTKSRLVLRMFDLVIISDRLSLSMPRDSQASQANVGRG